MQFRQNKANKWQWGQCRAVEHNTEQCRCVQYSAAQHSVVLYSTLQHAKHRGAGVTCSKLRLVMLAEGLTQGSTIEMLHPTFCIHSVGLI